MSKVTYKAHRKRPGCFLIFLLLIAVVIGFLWYTSEDKANFPKNMFTTTPAQYGDDEFPEFDEVWSYGSGSNKVVTIPVKGMIMLGDQGSLLSSGSSASISLRAIRRATLDKDVMALILDIDSGGGGITASDIIYNALLEFKKGNPNRRIIAIFNDIAASGAYYIALSADHIIAHPTTITGSIGVLVKSINLQGLALKHGIKNTTITSGANKDLMNPLAPFTEQQQALIQAIVDSLHDRFVMLVAKHRELSEETVRSVADGRILTSSDALKLGLVDEIGYWKDAMTRTAELLGVDTIKVYRYDQNFSFSDMLHASKSVNPKSWFNLNQTPYLQYRWSR